MNNRNSFKGEVTVRKNGYEDQPIKGALGYTMPTRPTQAISLMKQQVDRQISNQIMFVPFPQVRNVIVSFMKPYPTIDQDFSQILASEYQKNRLLQKLDNSINQNISRAYHQKIKLEKILKCFQKAQGLKRAVIQLKTNIRDSRQDDLGDRIRQIQSQYERRKFEAKGNEQKCTEIELQKNKMIIQEFQTHYTQYQQRNNDFIRLDFTFSEVREFCKEMQKTIPIIWRYEGIQDSNEDIRTQNFIEYFQLTIKQQLQPLVKFIHESQTWLEMFRNHVKSQSWANSEDSTQFRIQEGQLKQMNLVFDQCQQNIRLKVYQKLKEISKLDQYIVRNLSNEISANMSTYERFVETYTDIKQVCNTKNKWKDFYRIIAREEKLLSDHMRLNCGLVVYFKPTEDFQQFATGLSKRTYVEQIFRERLAPLNNAIKFINEEYSVMYKRACEDQYSGSKLRKDQVNKKLILFQKNLQSLQKQNNILQLGEENHYEYLTHLTLSLNRLMALAK